MQTKSEARKPEPLNIKKKRDNETTQTINQSISKQDGQEEEPLFLLVKMKDA